jgi:tRNA A-37 threonylcarbamoyl transferase component Bud32
MTRPVTTPGRLVAGRYRLQSQLGGGGMGTVWLARDELLGRQVAIKQVLTPVGISAEEADQQRQRALREGRIAARLSHPHAISVYDVALESGQPWLVMEYLPSRSLAAVLTQDGVLRSDQVAQIGAQVADALAATHAAGIVHRDVKPANILIGEGGRIEGLVKITDFGISHASGDITLTQTGQITGTPAFLAPEVAQGHEMTEASDVFSLGATLYTCVEGVPPFGMEENALAMLHRVAGGSILPPRRAGSLKEPLLRMLAADPADRPAMAEVRDQLAKLAAGRNGDTTTVLLARTDIRSNAPGRTRTAAFPAEPPTPVSPPPQTRTTPAPDPAPAAAAVAAGAAATGGGGTASAVADRPAQPPAPPAPPRKRRRGAWIAAALVAVLLAGLVVLLVTDPFGGDDGSEAQESQTPTTSAAPSTTAEPSATGDGDDEGSGSGSDSTTEETPTGNSGPGNGDPLAADNIQTFLGDYHAQVLSDPSAAYARTGPTLRANISEGNFVEYWSQFEDVVISDVQAVDGQNTARATQELIYVGGGSETSQRLFTFIVRDGELVLDSDFPA